MQGRQAQERLMVKHTSEIDTVGVILQPCQWCVVYEDQLIGIAKQRLSKLPKYHRTVFATRKPAQNLADKLNALFETQGFTVGLLQAIPAPPIVQEPKRDVKGRPPGVKNGEGKPRKVSSSSAPRYQTRASRVNRASRQVHPAGHVIYTDTQTGLENIKLKITKKLA